MRSRMLQIPALLLGASLLVAMQSEVPEEPVFTTDFDFSRSPIFLPHGENPYFPMQAGDFVRLEGEKDGVFVEIKITMLNKIQPIHFRDKGKGKIAFARVVEEREWVDGELTEVSLNYYAVCPRSGNVYNFGEDVDHYEDGRIVGHDGSWLAGRDGAKAGLIMPDFFLHGARYSLGFAPGISEDRAENMEMGFKHVTPAGEFENCIKVLETSSLEPDEESVIIYAPGVGIIADEELVLVEYNQDRMHSTTLNGQR